MQPPIFVINMKSSQDRWQFVSSQLAELGLEYQRMEARIGSQLSAQQREQVYCALNNKLKYHRDLTPGEIGCYYSHVSCWKAIQEQGLKWALILEDDVVLDKQLPQALHELAKLDNWDVIRLSNDRNVPAAHTQRLGGEFTLVSYYRVPNCANGYLVSASGVEKLLRRFPFYRPVDIDLQFHSEVNLTLLGISPAVVSSVQDFGSDIQQQNQGKHSNHSSLWRNTRYRISMFLQRKKESADLSDIKFQS